MGIFDGTETLFFGLGVLTTLLFGGLALLHRVYAIRWFADVMASTGIVLFVFSLAWAVSSALEGEPQAANMGLLVFGLPALLLMGLSRRFMVRRPPVAA